MSQCRGQIQCSEWVETPPKFWSGEDYCKSLQLRTNMLPTMGILSNPPDRRRCRAGRQKQETLCHVLQNCPFTYWKRIQRQDMVAKTLGRAAKKKGWAVSEQPHVRLRNGELRKPDLILKRGDTLVVTDVQISWDLGRQRGLLLAAGIPTGSAKTEYRVPSSSATARSGCT